MDDAVRVFDGAEAVGGVDEGNTGQEGGLLVFFRVADIDAFGIAVAFHDQADIFALGETGALPLLIVEEEVRGAGGSEESVYIAPLAVADDGQLVAFLFQGRHDIPEIRVERAAVGIEVLHLVFAADIENFIPAGHPDLRVQGQADFLHGHAHDAVDVVHGEGLQVRAFPLEDFVPGVRNGRGRVPQGAVQVKKQQGVLHRGASCQ